MICILCSFTEDYKEYKKMHGMNNRIKEIWSSHSGIHKLSMGYEAVMLKIETASSSETAVTIL
jgi:hypothetical protein